MHAHELLVCDQYAQGATSRLTFDNTHEHALRLGRPGTMTTGRLTAVLAAGQRQRRLASTGAPEPQNVPDNEVAWRAFQAEVRASTLRAEARAAAARAEERRGQLAEKEGMVAESRGAQAVKDAEDAANAALKARTRAEAWALEGNAELQKVAVENLAENRLRSENAASWAVLAFMAAEAEMGVARAQGGKAQMAATLAENAHKMAVAAHKDAREAAAAARGEAAGTRAAAARAASLTSEAATTNAEN